MRIWERNGISVRLIKFSGGRCGKENRLIPTRRHFQRIPVDKQLGSKVYEKHLGVMQLSEIKNLDWVFSINRRKQLEAAPTPSVRFSLLSSAVEEGQ